MKYTGPHWHLEDFSQQQLVATTWSRHEEFKKFPCNPPWETANCEHCWNFLITTASCPVF